MNETDIVVEAKNLTKIYRTLNRKEGFWGGIKNLFSQDYKEYAAVNDVSMTIRRGEIIGYLGPNGAGKSTIIKMMTGIVEATSGEILVNGRNPYKERTVNAREMGVVFGQRSQLWWALPLIESFKILKELYAIPDEIYEENMNMYREIVDIDKLLYKPVRQMSLGQRTLCDILAAFLHNPTIVFLDEPTIGLDFSMKVKIRDLIKELNRKRNTTVILTTHDIGDVEVLCNRVIIINEGKNIYDDSIEKLKFYFGKKRTIKILIKPVEDVSNTIKQLLNEQDMYIEKGEITNDDDGWIAMVINEEKTQIMDVLKLISDHFIIENVKIEEETLDEIIREIYEMGNLI